MFVFSGEEGGAACWREPGVSVMGAGRRPSRSYSAPYTRTLSHFSSTNRSLGGSMAWPARDTNTEERAFALSRKLERVGFPPREGPISLLRGDQRVLWREVGT